MRAHGFGKEEVGIIHDLLTGAVTSFINYNESSVEIFMKKAVANFSSIDQLVEAVQLEASERVEADAEVRMLQTSMGPCVLVESNVSEAYGKDGLNTRIIQIIPETGPFGTKDGLNGLTYNTFGGNAGNVYQDFDEATMLPREFLSVVYLTVSKTIKLHSEANPCVETDASERDRCLIKAFKSGCNQEGAKQPYIPGEGQALFSTQNRLMVQNQSQHCKYLFDKAAWLEACPAPCVTWTYETSVILAEPEEGGTLFYMRFNNPTRVIVYKEEYVITPDMFISNVGGQVSLWSGASMITLVHVMLYFGCRTPTQR